jgi:hypothetical protein
MAGNNGKAIFLSSILLIQVLLLALPIVDGSPSSQSVGIEGDDYDVIHGDKSRCTSSSSCSGHNFGTSVVLSPGTGWLGNDSVWVTYEPIIPLRSECIADNNAAFTLSMKYDTYSNTFTRNTHYQFKIYDDNSNSWDRFADISGSTSATIGTWQFGKTYLPASQYSGDYTIPYGSNTKLVFWLFVDESSEMEIDYLALSAAEESERPDNPEDPVFVGHNDGPGDWSTDNTISRVDFETSGDDNCEYDYTRYGRVFSSSSSSNLNCNNNAPSGTSTTSSASRIWSNGLTFSNDGYYRLCWKAYDGFGTSASSWEQSSVFKIDTTAPTQPSISSSNPGTTYWNAGSSALDIVWSPSTDTHSGVDKYEVEVVDSDGNSHDAGEWNHDGSSSYTFTASRSEGLDCGVNYVKIKALDNAGNSNIRTVQVNYDDCNPNAPNPNQVTGWYNTNSVSITFPTPNDDGCGIDSFDVNVDNGTWLYNQISNLNSPSWSANLAEGIHSVVFRSVDCASAANTAQNSGIIVRVDSLEPLANITSSSHPYSNWSSTHQATVLVDSQDQNPTGVSISGLDSVYMMYSNSHSGLTATQIQNYAEEYVTCNNTTGICSLTNSKWLENGTWYVWVVSKDAANNIQLTKMNHSIRIDNQNPTTPTPLVTNANAQNIVGSNVNISWSSGSDLHSQIAGYYYATDVSDVPVSTGMNYTNASLRNLSLSLGDGAHKFCLKTVDNAGNFGDTECTNLFVVDTQPALFNLSSDASSWINRSYANLNWSSWDENGPVSIRWRIANQGANWQSVTQNGSHNLTGLSSGVYIIEFEATDVAGHINQSNVTVQVDLTDPRIDYFNANLNSQGWSNTSSINLNWSVVDLHSGVRSITIHSELGNTSWYPNINSNNFTITLPDGVGQTITLIVEDEVGRVSTHRVNVSVDSQPLISTCHLNPSGWTTTNPDFYFNLNSSNISNVNWRIEWAGNSVTMPTSPFSNWHFSEGTTQISFFYENYAGTSGSCVAYAHVDRSSPQILPLTNLPEIINHTYISFQFDALDQISGLESVSVSVDGAIQYSVSGLSENYTAWRQYMTNLSLNPNGINNITIRVTDYAGLSYSYQTSVRVDTSPPVVNFSIRNASFWQPVGNGLVADWFVIDNQDTNVSVRLMVDGVIIDYPLTTAMVGGVLSFINLDSGNHTLRLAATDHANLTTFSQEIVVHIDSVTPTCSFSSSHTPEWSIDTLRTFVVNATGGPSSRTLILHRGWNQTTATIGGNSLTLPHGIHTLNLTVTSESGLICSTGIIQRVDIFAAQVNYFRVSQNIRDFGDGWINVEWDVSSDEAGSLEEIQLLLAGESYLEISQFKDSAELFINRSDLHNLTLQISDEAGNVVMSTESVDMALDRIPPTFDCWIDNQQLGLHLLEFEIVSTVHCESFDSSFAGEVMDIPIFVSLDDKIIPINVMQNDRMVVINHFIDSDRTRWSFTIDLGDVAPCQMGYGTVPHPGPHNLSISISDVLGQENSSRLTFAVTGEVGFAFSPPSSEPGVNQIMSASATCGHNPIISEVELSRNGTMMLNWINSDSNTWNYTMKLGPGDYSLTFSYIDTYSELKLVQRNFSVVDCKLHEFWNNTNCEARDYLGENTTSANFSSLEFDEILSIYFTGDIRDSNPSIYVDDIMFSNYTINPINAIEFDEPLSSGNHTIIIIIEDINGVKSPPFEFIRLYDEQREPSIKEKILSAASKQEDTLKGILLTLVFIGAILIIRKYRTNQHSSSSEKQSSEKRRVPKRTSPIEDIQTTHSILSNGEIDIDGALVKDLKVWCKDRGLKDSGLKKELQARLKDFESKVKE